MPRSTRAATTRKAPAAPVALQAPAVLPALPVFKLAKELRRWADTVLGMAGSAAELSLNLAKARAREPAAHAAIDKAGSLLRQAREAAGMTTAEVGQAIDIDNIALLEQAEIGKAALPFEVILRLAGVLGRHDPATFVMRLARSTNPQMWNALDDLGIGRLVVQAGRERELANIYRASDAARQLSDAHFAVVLSFVRSAFDLAVQFRSESRADNKLPRAAKPTARPAAKAPAKSRTRPANKPASKRKR
jgi:transcriptional regulator with XRE-family HTH domain